MEEVYEPSLIMLNYCIICLNYILVEVINSDETISLILFKRVVIWRRKSEVAMFTSGNRLQNEHACYDDQLVC